MEPVLTLYFHRFNYGLSTLDCRALICSSGATAHGIPAECHGKLLFYRRPVLGSQRVQVSHYGREDDPYFMRANVLLKTHSFLGLCTALQEALLNAKLVKPEAGTYTYYMKVIYG